MTLTEFLLARVAEDEAVARDAGERRGLPYESPLYVVDDNYRHDQVGIYPERVLAECEAKRRIVTEAFEVAATIDGEWGCCHDAEDIRRGYREPTPGWGDEAEPLPEGCAGPEVAGKFLQALAAVYAGHEDYRAEWAL